MNAFAEAASPLQTPAERFTQEAFEALMWALARPGEVRTLPEPGLAAAAASLLDAEVSFFASDGSLDQRLAETGARRAGADRAAYLFLDRLDSAAIDTVRRARTGSLAYPDEGATVFSGAKLGNGERLALSGPGVPGRLDILVGGVHPGFWARREAACRYPLGWDVFLLDGARVVGLPRSTRVEVL